VLSFRGGVLSQQTKKTTVLILILHRKPVSDGSHLECWKLHGRVGSVRKH
jgi:hypothetical protein